MKEISVKQVSETVARLFEEANYNLGEDVLDALKKALEMEESEMGKEVLRELITNAGIAAKEKIPLCQDCGTAIVFLEVGQDVHIAGGSLYDGVNDGVRRGYTDGYLRKSMVAQPFTARINTKDNTPAVVHIDIVPGDKLKISVMSKGGGSENMCRLVMLTPGDGKKGVINFVVKAVDEAGGKPCPPLIIGLGIGGTAEEAMVLSKKALLRRVGLPSSDPEVAALEKEILGKLNDLGVGPLGFGGRVTALAVQALAFPTHITSLPVAISFQCHSSRHREAIL